MGIGNRHELGTRHVSIAPQWLHFSTAHAWNIANSIDLEAWRNSVADLSGCKTKAELLHKGVDLLLLGNEGEQVAHDGLELLPGQAGLTGQVRKHVWQQVVDRACTLHHVHLVGTRWVGVGWGGRGGGGGRGGCTFGGDRDT